MIVGNSWTKKVLRDGDADRISYAVKLAEEKTMAEIVPMVVQRSAPIGQISLLLTLILFLVALLLDIPLYLSGYGFSIYAIPGILTACVAVGWALSRWPCFQRWMTSSGDLRQAAHLRAEIEFYRGHYNKTESGLAVLIFVSMMERQVVVLADLAISSKLSQEIWAEAVSVLIQNLKNRDLASGMIQAINLCGQRLAEHFPATGNNKNELSNRLVIKD